VGLARTKAYSGGTTTYTYDAANQLNLIWNNFGTFTNTYDGAGNVLNRAIPTMSPASFTWDGECRPTRVLGPDVSNAYIYNGNGQRVQVSTSSSSLNQVWHGENIPLEMNANIVEAAYTLEPTMYGNLISQSTPSDDLYYIFDGLGSTAFLWTGSGQNAGQYYYDAFGNVLDDSRFYATNAFQYIGRFGYYTETPDLGTYFLRARMYDPTTGRFLSRDPLGMEGEDINLYRYSGNSPNTFFDPSGMKKVCGFYAWLYTGRGIVPPLDVWNYCVDENVYNAALEAAGQVVNCWWKCEIETHKCVAGEILTVVEVVSGVISLATVRVGKSHANAGQYNPVQRGLQSFRLPATRVQLQTLIRQQLWDRGYRDAARAIRGFGRGPVTKLAKGSAVVAAAIEAGISINCGFIECS
jgi:RHS repeat-associated protein